MQKTTKQKNTFKHLVTSTGLSILVFFSISFISILTQINPLHTYKNHEVYDFNIGYPFMYYEQFMVRGNGGIPNSGWDIPYLISDCFITWLLTMAIYFLARKIKT